MKIVVTSQGSPPTFIARTNEFGYSGVGSTIDAAVGALVRGFPVQFGIERIEVRPRQDDNPPDGGF